MPGERQFPVLLLFALPLSAQVNVLTYQYDNTRAGANLKETVLTPGNVNANQFGKLFAYPVDGYVYGQPLYLAGVPMPGKGAHNVVYVATEHDSVYAFDADSNAGPNAAPLWQVSFLNPAAGVTTVPYQDTRCDQIVPEIGITSTPVIDPASGTLYVVAMTKESLKGVVGYVHRLHALDVSTGAERPGSPVTIQASYPGTGEGGSTLVFQPRNYKQRPGLLLLNGVVYTAWSSHCDIGVYHGWLIGYDARSLQQVAVYNNTPNGNEGSFWASGAAPAADAAGNIYLVAGNGTFDSSTGGPDLGESYIKLSPAGGLAVADYFAPFNAAALNDADVDVGSSGVALLGDEAGSSAHPHLMVGAGKEGRIYLLDRDNLGKQQAGSDSQIVQSIPGVIGSLFGNPAYFNQTVYFCGVDQSMMAFRMANGMLPPTPTSQTAARFAYPGCVPSISASGTANGIVWMLEGSPALHAYDASNLASELYNSNQNRGRDALGSYVKFSVPTVANGKVYAGTQNALAVYGLLSPGGTALAATNAASGAQNSLVPGSIVSIYGANLASSAAAAPAYPLPLSLAGITVSIGGLPAPLFYVSPMQINAQVPFAVPAGAATLTVSSGGAAIGTAAVTIRSTAPGLFTLAQGRAAALNQDYSVNSPGQPAAAGTILAAFLTGLGPVDNPVPDGAAAPANPLSQTIAPVSAAIGGVPAQVVFSGLAPGFAGLYQVNLVVPQLAPGDYPLEVSTGGGSGKAVSSNAATVSVR
ncbi:MAG TPA: hypothetical protein VFA33_21390 [Bryobacteraceae bacterium]|nr:hypothetical protein [Bryobacteraceae bacterium]